MNNLFLRIQKKKKQLDQLRPIPTVVLEKLKKQLALEWTYNSNAIEGNTLTLQETRLVLEEGMTIKGKPLREHFEAKNHENAIQYLEKIIQQNFKCTESHIFEIHKLVLDGIEEEFAGRYRDGQVRIIGANFIPPAGHKVPDLMTEFVKKVTIQQKRGNFLSLATFAHHRFVWIHPFFDGNGRTARLFMNLLLMKEGYPPAIILKNDRKKYYDALNQANKENYEKLTLLIGQAIERSLDIYISAFSTHSNEEYISLSQIAPHTPYSAEYLGFLARKGFINAYKQGRNWVSNLQSVQEYINRNSSSH